MQDNNKLVNKVSELQEVGTIGSLSATKKSKVWAFLSGNHSSTTFKKNAKLKCLAKSLYSKSVYAVEFVQFSVICHSKLRVCFPKHKCTRHCLQPKTVVREHTFFHWCPSFHGSPSNTQRTSSWSPSSQSDAQICLPKKIQHWRSPGPSQLPDFVISCQVILE